MLKSVAQRLLRMPDGIDGTAEQNESIVNAATNKSLNEFVADHVKEFVAPKEEDLEGEETNDALGSTDELDKKTEEKVEEKGEDKKEEKGEEKKEGEEEKKEDEKKEEKEGEEKVEEGEKKEEEIVEGKPVPYERFREVAQERQTFKQQIEALQPKVQNYDNIVKFCKDHFITPDQHKTVMEIQALLNTNPAEALKRLEPIVDSLKGFTGGKLPPDLQKDVDEGRLTVEHARRIARAEAQQQFEKTSAQQREKQREAMAMEAAIQQTNKAASDWERQKRSSDPDYKPSTNGIDGLWEDVRDKFSALLNQMDGQGNFVNRVATPQDMVALQERAYQAVKKKWTTNLAPKKSTTGKRLSSNNNGKGDDARTEENATSIQEAVKIRLQSRGINV